MRPWYSLGKWLPWWRLFRFRGTFDASGEEKNTCKPLCRRIVVTMVFDVFAMRRGGVLNPRWQSRGVTAASSSVKIACSRRRRRKTENFWSLRSTHQAVGQDDRKTGTESILSDGRPNLCEITVEAAMVISSRHWCNLFSLYFSSTSYYASPSKSFASNIRLFMFCFFLSSTLLPVPTKFTCLNIRSCLYP